MQLGISRPVTASTRWCAVLGWPVRHSASPAMHNAAFAALDMDWRYAAHAVRPEHVAEAIRGAQRLGYAGLNLTVPHKGQAVGCMDVLDEAAAEYGAVNTVVFETEAGGAWLPVGLAGNSEGAVRARGCNTDADGLIRSLREDLAIEPRSARVLLLGAGGAAQSAARRLAEEGVEELWLVNRTEAKAIELAEELAARHPALDVRTGYPEGDVEIVLNATSAGLHAEDPMPLDLGRFSLSRADAVYDMIYRPAETPLLRSARAAGARAANGLGMLLYQGAAAFELWTGRPAPVEVMRRALSLEVYGARP